MRVSRYDYEAQFGDQLEQVVETIRDALLQGRYGLDSDVRRFEEEFAEWLGVGHARGVNTGTDALLLALLAVGVRPGHEVIAPANTFHATVAAIALAGATPVLVDADPETYLMDVDAAAAALSERTRAIVPVHLYGKALPLDSVLALADGRLAVVEDAAQAHGAADPAGERAGARGHAGCFSFHPSKNLAAAGDGGMIVTGDAELAEDVDRRRSLGQRVQNDHVVVGLNSKLHALQAIVLRAKLGRLDGWNEERRAVARAYRTGLAGLPVAFQRADPSELHVYHLFQLRTARRDELLRHLRAEGVDAVVRYPVPIHLQPAFADRGWRAGQFPVAERLARELLCLPIRPGMEEREVEHVVWSVRRFFEVG